MTPSETFRFTCSDPVLPTDERNLCVRAAQRLAAEAGIEPHGALHLEKHIPHGAGLGGGSSDAAHTLRLLADYWELSPSPGALHALAATLGSDVPFFLHNEAMLATGRGEALEPLAEKPYRLPFTLVVAMPPAQIGTKEAYMLIRPNAQNRPDLRDLVRSNDLSLWRRELVNDFEEPILARYPAIHAARQHLCDAGAGYVALSGSGAAVFGVFEQAKAARRVAEKAETEGMRAWWVAGTSPR